MAVTREELKAWALAHVGLEAARKMAVDMPGIKDRKQNKAQLIEWMLDNDREPLESSYLIEKQAEKTREEPELCGHQARDIPFWTCTQPPEHTPPHRRGTSTWLR